MAKKIITESLMAVSRRNRIQRLFEALCYGAFYGILAAVPLMLFCYWGFFSGVKVWAVLLVMSLLGLGFGALIGWLLPIEDKTSAEKADTYYRLKDRLLTALRLIAKSHQTPIERLQISDAAEYAKQIDAKVVVPYRLPRSLPQTTISLILALVICVFLSHKNPQNELEAALLPVQEVVTSIDTLKEELVDWVEEKAKENPDEKELKELSEELDKQHAKLEETLADPREAIAVMSEMEAAANATMSEYNLEAMDASLKDVADALSVSEVSRSAAQAMKDGDYAKASEELKSMDVEEMSKLERNAISDQLKKAASNMQKRNQKQLAKLAEKMADELQENNCEGACESACEIAGVCEKQGLRKGICQALGSKLALLSLCKSDCAGACQGQCNKNGSQSDKKSNTPSNNWGRGTAGQPDSGEETNLDGNRDLKQITGMQGQGPSEYEKIISNEGNEEQTGRTYSETYQEFRKMSESVLESEPIPLGQRRMIRQYFESIRPQGDEMQNEK